ncbi:FK506-binding protein 2A [Dissostichus eleginoides]|nr:FK506-binding protein 2A [Dissostichus eleginoides]
MRLLLFFAVTMLSLIPAAMSGGEKKKLQIGIKKRVDNCPIKSRKGDVLNMHYTGKLEDGTEFDSSIPRDRPFTFTLGTGQVIKGWDQGLLGMCEGEKRKLVIPSELGYGDRGAPPKIPGGATLIFEVPRAAAALRGDYLTSDEELHGKSGSRVSNPLAEPLHEFIGWRIRHLVCHIINTIMIVSPTPKQEGQ